MRPSLSPCNAVEDGSQAPHAICPCGNWCSKGWHKPHAPGSASRQRLGESHQVEALEEDRPRHLTWAFGVACLSKQRCMRMLLSELQGGWSSPCRGACACCKSAGSAHGKHTMQQRCSPRARTAQLTGTPALQAACMADPRVAVTSSFRFNPHQAFSRTTHITSGMLLTIPAALCFPQYIAFVSPAQQ